MKRIPLFVLLVLFGISECVVLIFAIAEEMLIGSGVAEEIAWEMDRVGKSLLP